MSIVISIWCCEIASQSRICRILTEDRIGCAECRTCTVLLCEPTRQLEPFDLQNTKEEEEEKEQNPPPPQPSIRPTRRRTSPRTQPIQPEPARAPTREAKMRTPAIMPRLVRGDAMHLRVHGPRFTIRRGRGGAVRAAGRGAGLRGVVGAAVEGTADVFDQGPGAAGSG